VSARTRAITHVCVTPSEAADFSDHLKRQGRHPRTYERMARAENMTVVVLVIVADRVQA
jgi:hypothetical protein